MQNIQSTLIKGMKKNIWKTMGTGRGRQTGRTIKSNFSPRSSSSFNFTQKPVYQVTFQKFKTFFSKLINKRIYDRKHIKVFNFTSIYFSLTWGEVFIYLDRALFSFNFRPFFRKIAVQAQTGKFQQIKILKIKIYFISV